MKKTLIFAFVSLLILGSCKTDNQGTDNKSGDGISASLAQNKAVYQQAKKNGDFTTAVVALNYIIQEDSSIGYLDTLTQFYILMEKYESAVIVGDQVLKARPDKDSLREMVAQVKLMIGLVDDSKEDFDILYKKYNNTYYLYFLALIDAQKRNMDECMSKIEKLLAAPDAQQATVPTITQSGMMQNVNLLAGTYYLKGMVYLLNENNKAAEKEFLNALKIEPDYENAKVQLAFVRQGQKNTIKRSEEDMIKQKYRERGIDIK